MEMVKLFSSHNVLISENQNSDTAEAKFVICDFDPNKNDVSLARATIDTWKDTLINKPLVGKVVAQRDGTKDFTGHNVVVVQSTDENGNTVHKIEFDTSSFGVFTSVDIEEIDGAECIVATATVWKRFSQAYEVFAARATSEEGIKTSWEIQVSKSHKETIENKEVKVIDEGVFIGHAVLGSKIAPAYDSSGLLSVASEESNDDFEQALLNDIYLIASKQGEEKQLEDKQTQVSALTTRDLHQKTREALNPKGWNSNPYYSIWEIYPVDNKILAYDIDRDSEDDYLVITYSVADDVVTIGEKSETKLSKILSEKQQVNISVNLDETAKLLSTKETEIQSLSGKVAELTEEVAEKDEKLIKASEQIVLLQSSVDELQPFKVQVEEIQQAEDLRIAETKREDLKSMATNSGYISVEELESSEEIQILISELDEKGLKVLIAERVISGVKPIVKEPEMITSQSNTNETLNTSGLLDNVASDPSVLMSTYLNTK